MTQNIRLPEGWHSYKNEKTVIFYKPIINNINENKKQLIIEKQIVFNDSLEIEFFVDKFCIQPEIAGISKLSYPIDLKCLTETIIAFNWKQKCQGGPKALHYPGNSYVTGNIFYFFFHSRSLHLSSYFDSLFSSSTVKITLWELLTLLLH